MATNLVEVIATKTAALASLKLAMTDSSAAGGKPNATGGGVNVGHREWVQELKDTISWCDEQIAILQGPIDIETRYVT